MTDQATHAPAPRRGFGRRDFLRLAGFGTAAASLPLLSGCGNASEPLAVADITGSFSWTKYKGQTVRLLLSKHPYTEALKADQKAFSDLTGITLVIDEIDEGVYFDKLGAELDSKSGAHDVFMLGAYMTWQYGPKGQLEDLGPWMRNAAATSDEFRPDDFHPNLLTAGQWSFRNGDGLGGTQQWLLPWGFETDVIAYRKDVFDKLGIKPPATFDELRETGVYITKNAARAGFDDMYGVAVRGTRDWGTIHPGFMTMYSRLGLRDYDVQGRVLVPRMDSPKAIEFTKQWAQMAKDSGPRTWTSYTWQMCAADLGTGKAAILFDADNASHDQADMPAVQGKLAWYPGPKGPDGSLATNLWTWSLAMAQAAQNKPAAWLFMQWATGKDHLMRAALNNNQVDTVRKSIADSAAYKAKFASLPGYLDTFQEVISQTRIQFTPQRHFFDSTNSWAGALQDIYLGADPTDTLRSTAQHLAVVVNAA